MRLTLRADPRADDAHWLRLAATGDPITEVGSSDDRRLLGSTPISLERVIDTTCYGCWAAGGSVNGSKLKTYHVRQRSRRLQYVPGIQDIVLGPLVRDTHSLQLVRIPLLMDAIPVERVTSTTNRLRKILSAVKRLRPPYLLVQRIVRAFGLSPIDYLSGLFFLIHQCLWMLEPAMPA